MAQLKDIWTVQLLLVLLALQGEICWGNLAAKRRDTEASGANSLVVHIPNHFFDFAQRRNWRAPGVFSPSLEQYSIANPQEYTKLAKAQDKEDVWLYDRWVFGMKNGVMVESGALDGNMFSTSFMFETFANWTSVHIEADPSNYKRLTVNRPRSINVHGGLCAEPTVLHYSSHGSQATRGFVELMQKDFLKRWHPMLAENASRINDLPTVQCLPAKFVFQELGIRHIDIWVLDVEGAEESVLRGMDFNEVHVNIVAIECSNWDLEKNKRKVVHLESQGFQCMQVDRNCMCKNKLFEPRASPRYAAGNTHA